MPKPLVIVESPAKAKTIAGYLGTDYVVESSIGHIRDLPRSAADVPAAFKAEPWARLGVDVDNDFKPLYVVSREKREQVAKLRRLVSGASEIYLATDEDREGESIAWHLYEVLSPTVPVLRMVFHEITPAAIRSAIEHPRELDRRLVDAQEARRILDRLYGYEVSPVLWRKVAKGLSAGRVQSVATRIVVERERERMRFRSASWCNVEGSFSTEAQPFSARLVDIDGRRVATGEDFAPTGTLVAPEEVVLLDEPGASGLVAVLDGVEFTVESVEERPYRRSPAAPFITSTLQQEAARKLRFSAQRTMQVAQHLYERGYITYMRTDSTTLSDTAVKAAREQARALYGENSVPRSPRVYRSRVKNAQEAHEAIRPAGDRFRTPSQLGAELKGEERRLYELVWQRTVASQMNDATGTSARARIEARTKAECAVASAGTKAAFVATGTVITNPGFLAVYREGDDDNDNERRSDQDVRLPRLVAGNKVNCDGLEVEDHATKPPARYTEASLVRRLEELGVGRPSTYASIIGTIQDRGYVWKKGTALVPSFTAFAVVGLLEEHFANLVDYGFTASMEDDLDEIASGGEEQVPWLERFYFGESAPGAVQPAKASGRSLAVDGVHGLKQAVSLHLAEIDAREVNSILLGTDADGREIVVRVGRYGPYLQRGDDRAAVPDDLAPDEVTLEKAAELLETPSSDRVLGQDPATGKAVLLRAGRFGPYVQLGEAAAETDKPRTASLLKTMEVSDVTLEEALRLLQLPRSVGADPETGEEIIAANGRFGPFLKRGTETRSLETEDQLFSVTIEEALNLFSAPKQRRYGVTAAPLRELGADPESGSPIVLRSGRFGPYVTDGTTNASLRRGDDPDELTLERAAELIADRRAAGPSKRGARKATGTKKAGARKATAAKKTGARKATAAKKTAPRKATAAKTTAAGKASGTRSVAGAKTAAAKKSATRATATARGSGAKKLAAPRAPGAALRTTGAGSTSRSEDW
ncbi:MAG: type I DNA topoisomerase [Acidimicrobiales bacterium]|jgi:DNA topoisomerase-1